MKKVGFLAVCVCLALIAVPSWGQANKSSLPNANQGILGHLDSRTRVFTPLRMDGPVIDATTLAPTYGTFIVGLTVTLATNFPQGETFICAASATSFDTASFLSFVEEATVAGIRNGSQLTCTVTIPYSWRLMDPASATVDVGFSIQALGPSSLGNQPTRITSQGIVSNYPVPPNNKTTTFHLGAVI